MRQMHSEGWKKTDAENIHLDEYNDIRDLEVQETYKYLGTEENTACQDEGENCQRICTPSEEDLQNSAL